MKVYRCEDCQNLIGNVCCVHKKDKDDSIVECFKNSFKFYKEKYNPEESRVGINFKP